MKIKYRIYIAFNLYETVEKEIAKMIKAGTQYETYFVVTFKDNTIEKVSAKDIIEIA